LHPKDWNIFEQDQDGQAIGKLSCAPFALCALPFVFVVMANEKEIPR